MNVGEVAALAGVVGGLSAKPTRKLLDRMLPDPGEGPSEAAREKGFFRIDITTTTASGAWASCAPRWRRTTRSATCSTDGTRKHARRSPS